MKFFAYKHINGQIFVKRHSQATYDDAFESDFVDEVSSVIDVASRADAESWAEWWGENLRRGGAGLKAEAE